MPLAKNGAFEVVIDLDQKSWRSDRQNLAVAARFILLLAALGNVSAGCESKKSDQVGGPAQPVNNYRVITLGSEPVSITKISTGDIVRVDQRQYRLGQGSLRFGDGSDLQVVQLAPGDFIDINGLKVEGGRIQVSNGTPRFIENGVMIVDDFAEGSSGPVDVRVLVSVGRNPSGGELRRLGVLAPKQGELRCVTDIDGHKLNFTMSNNSSNPKNLSSDAKFISALAMDLPKKGNPSMFELTVIIMSSTIHPPGFRFALEQPDAYGQYGSGFRVGFVDADLKR